MSDTDLELLARYTREHAEDAFAEIVSRRLNLVYSAALRQVRSPQLAEEVAQATFIKLARQAQHLAPNTILTAWLYQVTRREAIDVIRREARRQLREQIAAEMNVMNATATDWTLLEPLIDEAMTTLDDADRTAVLIRYFENKSLREVGQTLGTSDNAAQKRVTRAVERLREFFSKRGVTIGASGLVVAITANAVHAAPVGLAVTIFEAIALVGTTIATTSATATKALVMTTLQKAIIGATLTAAVSLGIYEAGQAAKLREQNQTLQQQQAPLAKQIVELNQALINATNQLAALRQDNERLNRNTGELLKLRGKLGLLHRERNSEQDQQHELEKTESEWIKSIVYFGNEEQLKLWRSRGSYGIQVLVRALKSPEYDRSTRMCVASLISQLQDYAKSAMPDLVGMLKTEKDDGVRGVLLGYFEGHMEELGETERSEMFPELIRGSKSADSSVRNNALVLLQSYSGQSEVVIPLMVKALQDSSPGVQVMAVQALEKIDPQNSAGIDPVAVLARCLTGPPGDTPGAANEAAITLGQLQRTPELAIPALIQGLQNADDAVRGNSASALGKFGAQAKPALEALAKALEDSDNRVRGQASSAIARINSATSPK